MADSDSAVQASFSERLIELETVSKSNHETVLGMLKSFGNEIRSLVTEFRDLNRKQGDISREQVNLEAKIGTTSNKSLGVVVGILLSALAVVISIIGVVGALALGPLRFGVDMNREAISYHAKEQVKIQIEQAVQATTIERNESDIQFLLKIAYANNKRDGTVDALIADHAERLRHRTSERDGAQDARIEAMESDLKIREPYFFRSHEEGGP